MVIALVGNKADLLDEDDRNKKYGKYTNYSVLDTEEDNEHSDRSEKMPSRRRKQSDAFLHMAQP